jgi:hypothetical protein
VGPDRWREPVLSVTRGALLATPLLLLFGGLFVAADAVFEELVRDVFGFDVAEVAGHVLLAGLFAWTSAGILWVALLARNPASLAFRRPGVISLGILEIGVVLGLLDVLFLAFVVVQVRYLFGGAERVVSTVGLSYAEYARRGFFELVIVTALVLPMLLLAHWLVRAESRAHVRVFRVLAGTMVVLLSVVMASALQRMYLYQQEFGLTELRLYATVFMLWISVVLVWFVLTVLRGRRDRFAFGALVTGLAAILVINAVNPDAIITRTNVARMQAGERFDPYYLTTLSSDAVPALVESLPKMDRKDRSVIEDELRDRWSSDDGGWRTWNLSRSRAQRLAATADAGADQASPP